MTTTPPSPREWDAEVELMVGEDGMPSQEQRRQTKSRMLYMGGAITVILLVVAVIIINTIPHHDDGTEHATMPLDEWLDKKFAADTVEASWHITEDALFFVRSQDDNNNNNNNDNDVSGPIIMRFDASTGHEDIFLRSDEIHYDNGGTVNITRFSVSPMQDYVLVLNDSQPVFRHSVRADYFVVNMTATTRVARHLNDTKLQYALWNQGEGHLIAFVRDNNVYIYDMDKEEAAAVTQTGGETLVHGVTDWLYEEEVFGTDRAMWWSPQGTRLAFASFDDVNVPLYDYPKYGDVYPETIKLRYPKAGYPNPRVIVSVYDVATGDLHTADLTVAGFGDDIYLNGDGKEAVVWSDEDTLYLRVANRLQNTEELLMFKVSEGTHAIRRIGPVADGWLNPMPGPTFLGTSDLFADIVPDSGFRRLGLYDRAGQFKRWLTPAAFDVMSIDGCNAAGKTILFTSAEVHPTARNLYSVSYEEEIASDRKQVTEGKVWWNTLPSKSGKYLLLHYAGPEVPYQKVYELKDDHLESLYTVQDNAEVQARMDKYAWPKKEFLTINGANGDQLNAYRLLPIDFDHSRSQPYPVIMHVYGGPESQAVTQQFKIDFNVFLATLGYVVVSVDGRGTGARGQEFSMVVYKQLGKLEVADQVAAAKWLQDCDFVDRDRLGYWGWSYGGFMSLSILMHPEGSQIFRMGVAVAPVTDWRSYDSAYTERYMQTPSDNPTGYDDSSVLSKAGNLQANLLLVHGTGDDNVHFSNSADLVTALVNAGKLFNVMYYPNEQHSLKGEATTRHLYTMLRDYILKTL